MPTTIYYIALHCMILYCTLLTVQHSPTLYYTVLHCIVLYYTVLHCTTLHSTILYTTHLVFEFLYGVSDGLILVRVHVVVLYEQSGNHAARSLLLLILCHVCVCVCVLCLVLCYVIL